MRRVIVIGCSGAGKSTFARKFADRRGLPLIELDRAYWRAGWIEPPADEWRDAVARLVAAPSWIMDGNYAGTFDIRMPAADAIVWLDFPRAVCLRRVVSRVVRGYGRPRVGLPEGCAERFDPNFLRYVWEFPTKHRPKIEAAIDQFGRHARLFHLRNDRDARRLLATGGAA